MLAGSLLLVTGLLAAAPAPDVFAATSPADEQPTGRLLTLTAAGNAKLATANGAVPVADVISLRRVGVAQPPLPRGPVLLTAAGDRIPGRLLGGDDTILRFQPRFSDEEWSVPLSTAVALGFVRPPVDVSVDPARDPQRNTPGSPARRRDTLRLRNGDILTGTLSGFAAEETPALRFQPTTGNERSVPFTEIAAVFFNPSLTRFRPPKGPFARLVFRDGTRLAVTGATIAAGRLKAKTLFGQTVDVPLTDLVSLDAMRGKAVYLADVKPRKVEQAGFLGPVWPWTANRTVRGTPLRLITPNGEATFDRGIGTHPRTVLTYDLNGKYRRFEARVGLDAATGAHGRAVVRVRVDGREQPLPELARLAAGPAVPIRVDIRGAKELTLEVDFGPMGDVQADVNWGDARLVE